MFTKAQIAEVAQHTEKQKCSVCLQKATILGAVKDMSGGNKEQRYKGKRSLRSKPEEAGR